MNSRIRPVRSAWLLAAPSILLLALTAGCDSSSHANNTTSSTAAAPSNSATPAQPAANVTPQPESRIADQVLKDMEAAYRKATTYADNGEVYLRFEKEGQALDKTLPFSIAFERPNKLRLECYDVKAIADGSKLHASVATIPNLVLELPSPAVLTVDDVTRDAQMQAALVSGPGGPPVQLPFLMADNTLAQLLQDAMQPPKLLPPDVCDSRPCNRIEIDGSEGRLVLWIDQQENILRRIELPTREFQKLLEQEGKISNLTLTINFNNAQFNRPIDAVAFKFEIPKDAEIVDKLYQELKPAAIAAHTDPAAFKLTKLWTAADIKDPGNLVVVEDSGQPPRIFALDGWRSVVELDADGKSVARHDLEIPAESAVTYLRTATGRDGRRYFVASADGQQQVHLFDSDWKYVLSYPKPDDLGSDMIGDAELVDLDGDGQLDLAVGYWGDTGVQRVSLSGERLWREPSMQLVLRMTASDPDADGHRRLLCTNSRGTIIPVTAEGKAESEIVIPNRHMHKLIGADLEGNGRQDFCGLAGSITNDFTALGIGLDGRELWNYALPPGVPARPIEMVTAGDVNGDGAREWIIAGADGSIHLLTRDGKAVDKFNYGASLSGLGFTRSGDQRLLLVSSVLEKPNGDTKGTLEAWKLEPADK